ncbi:hypothetical protein D3C79_739730 [compost metagenome]
MRVRVATLLAMACCTLMVRLALLLWLTVSWLPWARGRVLLAWTLVCLPLSRVSLSSIWKS